MLGGFVLFGENCAYVGLIVSVALARHPRAAPASKHIIPNTIRVVFADPPYAKTNGTVLIHPEIGNI
jgi:16S rRNA G966 N2-methylase RsmD